MDRVRVNPDRPDEEVLARAAALLGAGGVVAYPTETFYALGANALDVNACARIRRLKGREADKPFPLVVADLDQLQRFCECLPASLYRLAERFWPGPLTLVLPARSEGAATAGSQTVAVRVSGLAVARELPRVAGCALTATSANRSHAPPARSAEEVADQLADGTDLLLDGGPTKGGTPSTIVDLTGSRPRLLRQGVVPFGEVLGLLEEKSQGGKKDPR